MSGAKERLQGTLRFIVRFGLRPALFANQLHEPAAGERTRREAGFRSFHAQQLLLSPVADGNDQAAADPKLIAEGLRNFRRSRSDEDPVVRPELRAAKRSIADQKDDVAVSERFQSFPSRSRQFLDSFDRDDFPAQRR